MKKKNYDKNDIVINLKKDKDDIEFGEESIHITSEEGIKMDLPYEKVEVKNKRQSFKNIWNFLKGKNK